MKIFSPASAKKKTQRFKGFRFCTFMGCFQMTSWQWRSQVNAELAIAATSASALYRGAGKSARFHTSADLNWNLSYVTVVILVFFVLLTIISLNTDLCSHFEQLCHVKKLFLLAIEWHPGVEMAVVEDWCWVLSYCTGGGCAVSTASTATETLVLAAEVPSSTCLVQIRVCVTNCLFENELC